MATHHTGGTMSNPALDQARRRTPVSLSEVATARAAGVLIGAAVGDSLGVPYEFGSTELLPGQRPAMIGGGLGPYAPGEYSDDTQMHVCVAKVAATGADLRTPEALDAIALNFLDWIRNGASDRGMQTSAVLSATARSTGAPGTAMTSAAAGYARRNPRSAGNGSLMRTGIVALAHLGDVHALAEAARAVSSLTHADPLAGDACVLWCSGIRTAVLKGSFDGVREGLALLPGERRDQWAAWLDEAESNPPRRFNPNGFVVSALQAAWSAIIRTPIPEHRPERGSFRSQHFTHALEAAVHAGNDTDTVAAIAGMLLGARWGIGAIPLRWQQSVHGWPGLQGPDLMRLAVLTARQGRDEYNGWPSVSRIPSTYKSGPAYRAVHPHDSGVLLGNLPLTETPQAAPVDAVVSLCRVGTDPILAGRTVEHVQVWLVDLPGANTDPDFVLDQAAREVLRLRREGKRVLIHCVAGRSRTAAVAARYSSLRTGTRPMRALQAVHRALGGHWRLPHNPDIYQAVFRLAGGQPQPWPGHRDAPRRDWNSPLNW
ncbi:ADP-ribosylglycohydrolase family protein [Kitasatospora sp. NPDC056783]|uniref:ADP-ribosylglycohydrolase family protein n=1 Tax=Kitasatospora sp. NPDC056783 TaxID=3345943 RepID=UPI0036C416CF